MLMLVCKNVLIVYRKTVKYWSIKYMTDPENKFLLTQKIK